MIKQIKDVLEVNHLAKKRMYDRSHWRYSLGDFNASADAICVSRCARVCIPSSVTLE